MVDILGRLVTLEVGKGVVEGFRVGKDLVSPSHLQFSFFCSCRDSSFIDPNSLLPFLRQFWDLRLIGGKSSILSINRCRFKLSSSTSMVGCEVGEFLSSYFGLPLWGNPRSFSF